MPDHANGNPSASLPEPTLTGEASSQAPSASAASVPPVTVDLANLGATDGAASSQAPSASAAAVPTTIVVMTNLGANDGQASSLAPSGGSGALVNPATEADPKIPSAFATRDVLGRTRELFCRLTAPFSAIIDFVIRITEASETRVYENGNTKISE